MAAFDLATAFFSSSFMAQSPWVVVQGWRSGRRRFRGSRAAAIFLRFFQQLDLLLEQFVLQLLVFQLKLDGLFEGRFAGVARIETALDQQARRRQRTDP